MVQALNRERFETAVKECGHCARNCHLGDEVVLVRIVEPAIEGDGTLDLLDYEDTDDSEEGEYLFQPYVFHRECWAEIYADFETSAQNDHDGEYPMPRITDPAGLLDCEHCKSEMRAGETILVMGSGKLSLALRKPDGADTPAFHENESKRGFLCLVCTRVLNEAVIEMWDEDTLTQGDECAQGRVRRCWKTESCKDGCPLRRDCKRCGEEAFVGIEENGLRGMVHCEHCNASYPDNTQHIQETETT